MHHDADSLGAVGEVEAVTTRDRGAVAVVGMACRLPGADGPDAYWRLLRQGRDAIAETPPERWAMYGLEGPDETTEGLRRGGYLEGVDRFDAGFFGISPREAAAMDPQQRLMLELSWEALERAGIPPDSLAGEKTGVYVGAISSDYAGLLRRGGIAVARQAFTGTQRGIIANRVSYFLGLRGPSVTVDSGQSSGLVSVHLACESLLAGESTLALAGGVNLNVGPDTAVNLAALGALSPDGRCFTFDARANGFVRGEGGGVVVLKPLQAALDDGDPILSVIRGSAVNNDGGGEGLTAPDRQAQEEVLRLAYERAGVAPGEVPYVELHGTGTPLGDRIEAAALGRVLGAGRPAERPLLVGSAKTNIGHLEGAAGIAGLIKAALSVGHREIAPSLNFDQANPEIPLAELGLRVQAEREPWPKGSPAVAGVSSFGIGGTNCHLVLEAPPEPQPRPQPIAAEPPLSESHQLPFPLSAKGPKALREAAGRLASHVEERELRAEDVGYSLATTRASLSHRAVVVADGTQRLLDGLGELAADSPAAHVIEGVAEGESGGPVFVFPGQGGQWPGMAVELMESSPVFAERMRACAAALEPHVDFELEGVLRGEPGQPTLEPVAVVQPVLFAVMVSLAALWESCGVRPAAVVGHSQGEIAAAHVAGGLSLADAAHIVAARSRALAGIEGAGGMMAVALPAEQVAERAGDLGERITVAAVNGPESVVVSGDPEALNELERRCEAEGVRAGLIRVSYASHSAQVEAAREDLLQALAGIQPRPSDVPVYSTVTGGEAATELMDAEHWFRNLRQTVRYADAIEALLGEGRRTFIEVSPHPVLGYGTEQTAEAILEEQEGAAIVPTLRRDEGGPARFLTALSELWVQGGEVDWGALHAGSDARRVPLPTYPFQRSRHWTDLKGPAADEALAVAPEADAAEPRPDEKDGERSFADGLTAMPDADRRQAALDLVRAQAALVLGHDSPDAVEPQRAFKELGFDSPAAVELRNRLSRATGLRLPATLVFDHPTPAKAAEELLAIATGRPEAEAAQAAVAPAARAADEPVAIVGIACRFPGEVRSAEELWELVASGGSGIGELPADRGWDLERLFEPQGDGRGAADTLQGGFIYDADQFDAEHFAISPREALAMDPQQRLLLECAWEALEDASIDPLRLRGSSTGVFAGIYGQDYGPRMQEGDEATQGYALTGTSPSVASGRVAYTLGLEGPAVSVDTACSSSLVAMHLACQALRQGECDLALAGGASVMASPGILVDFSRQGGLSPDGRCRAYGAGADGTGFSEGVGLLVLEPLSRATERGHRVLAVIRGSATNQDGASNGLTAPSGPSQERVIRQALAASGLEPDDVDAVEGHGTGTKLGDPIEAGALIETYGRERSDGPLWLGSIKSNIGHTQAAAGVAGVIKMVMALRHGELPPTLHVEELSPHIDWDAADIRPLRDPVEWPGGERPRRAAVSSFGISGTNAHLIIEEAPAPSELAAGRDGSPEDEEAFRPSPLPFLVSGSSEEALRAQARALGAHLEGRPELDLGGAAATLALGRAQLSHRAAVRAASRDELLERLRALAAGEPAGGVIEGIVRGESRVAFVFPGQGGQWEGMALELWETSPVFAESMEACAAALAPHLDWMLEDVLRGAPGAPTLERVDVVQPALFAVMVSLAALWRSFGVEPAVVVGHSQGEIAAAHVAGALSLEDAARVVALRARALGDELSGRGGMLSLAAAPERVEALLRDFEGRVSLATVNGPSAVVVSGEPEALGQLIAQCEREEIRAKLLPVDYASHSHQIEAIRERLLGELATIEPRPAEIPFHSATTATPLQGTELDAAYWYRNLRETVRFEQAIRSIASAGPTAFIELGPHPVLSMAVEQTAEAAGEDVRAIPSLRRDEGGLERFTASLAEAHVNGVAVDWRPLLAGARRVELPTYAFQHRRYWLAPSGARSDAAALGQRPASHPLLGAMVALAEGEGALWTGRVSLAEQPWLADHAVLGAVLVPGTAFLELALHAGAESEAPVVSELTLAAPLVLAEGEAVALQLRLSAPDEQGRRRVAVHSRPEGAEEGAAWSEHATGTLSVEDGGAEPAAPAPPAGGEQIDPEAAYARLAEAGYEYGPAFQGLRRALRSGESVYAEVALDEQEAARAEAFELHPALADAALHAAALAGLEAGASGAPQIPFSFAGVRVRRRGATALTVEAQASEGSWSVVAADRDGAPVLSIEAVRTRPLDPSRLAAEQGEREGLYAVGWTPLAEAPGSDGEPRIAMIGAGVPVEEPGAAIERLADLRSLVEAVAAGATAPEHVLVAPEPPAASGMPEAAHQLTASTLELLQAWLEADELAESRLTIVTRRALAAAAAERPDLRQAPLAGLLRSARSEHPDRFALIDTDGGELSRRLLAAALGSGEPELALREGSLLAPRLKRFSNAGALAAPDEDGGPWRVEIETPGTLESLRAVPAPAAAEPLEPGEVRVAVHAAGLNFRDVAVALGLVDVGDESLGVEGAGVVTEVGAAVDDLAVGDRVMGLIPDCFGPVAVTDRRLVTTVPAGWSHAEAASIPAVFLTAYYGLVELAGLKAGESLLLHGAAGGVGMAALQIARHLGAEVYATAHPGKWETLRGLGLDEDHIASSRSADFEQAFRDATEGRGVDVVLDSLAGPLVDASLRLLPRGGRFIEIGKTEIRDPAAVAESHPGVSYEAFDLMRVEPERIAGMLAEIVRLFDGGGLQHLPITCWDVRHAPDAFRVLRDSRHTGKLVLSVPQPARADGTVLITGGTGGLGALLARRMAERGQARNLLLVSRSGPEAPGASELAAELRELGCEVEVVACDVADREELERLLAGIPPERPLGAVVHAAGMLDDGVITALDGERLRRVMVPKLDAAVHLDQLTRGMELSDFVLFSSAATTVGSPGQGNYAAANAFLDALAHARRADGLPGLSLDFGVWERATGMTEHLRTDEGMRGGPLDMVPLPDELGLELIETARRSGEAVLAPMLLDLAKLRGRAQSGVLPPVFSGLVRPPRRAGAGAERPSSLAGMLAGAPESERGRIVLDLVRTHAAAVLGHASTDTIPGDRPFKELGFDSLAAVELRNRIAAATGLTLPATLIFDHPTPAAVAELLRDRVEDRERAPARTAAPGPRALDEPIAIVGMACRYPGGVHSPEELWELVMSRGDAIGGLPRDRGWDLDGLFDPDPDHRGTAYATQGGFLDDAGEFDAEHFSISPREALAMDPQQRLLLESSWEALEDAGIDPLRLRGSATGMYAGVFANEYAFGADPPPELEGLRLTGSSTSVISGRVAYTLGLEGPAVSVDTACSSSLVAMHLACQALRQGECDLALAGGTTVLATPTSLVELSRQRGVSPDGRCHAYGAAANGMGWAEGVGVVVLESLSRATERGHRVLAVIRGSATNQDGASNGLTAPSGPSQERVIRQALAASGLEPDDVDAVEGHGTGTKLGDPIEAGALIETYGRERSDGPLWLGSIKSNIGHTQAAAGVAGVIKMVMALRHGELPPTLHVEELSPHIDWDAADIRPLRDPVEWPGGERPRRAAVSSFGISGTNAHLLLEEAPADATPVLVPASGGDEPRSRPGPLPFLVSGSSDAALRAQMGRLRKLAEANPELDPVSVAGSLALARAQLPHRAVALASGIEELAERLGSFERGEAAGGIVRGTARGQARVAFVFPGQGGQWEGMALELWETSPVFAESMEACLAALAPHLDFSLEDVLRGAPDAADLGRIEVVQPALFAVMVSLAALWRSFGVEPAVVVGHSQGEIAAAHVAGALSLEDAARVVALRARALGDELSGRGGMLSLAAAPERVEALLRDFEGRVSLATVNGPSAVVVSGEPEALGQLIAQCEREEIRAKLLPVDYASHSHQIEAIRERLLGELATIEPRPAEIPFHSATTATPLQGTELDAAYWYRNLRETVRFEQAIRSIASAGPTAFIELGPHPVLSMAVEQTAEAAGEDVRAIPSLRRDEGGLERFTASLAEAHVNGVAVDWRPLLAGARRVELPTYAFQHRRYWLAPSGARSDAAALGQRPASHPLLGAMVALAEGEGALWTGRVSLAEQPWLADHAVLGAVLVPGTAFLELALHAGAESEAPVVSELTLAAPLVLAEGEAVALQLRLSAPDEQGRRRVAVHSRPEGAEEGAAWSEHATGTLSVEDGGAEPAAPAPPAGGEQIDPEAAYARLAEAGYEYGPAFQGLRRALRSGESVYAEVALDEQEAARAEAFELHPALADAALHAAALAGLEAGASGAPQIPFSFAGVRVRAAGASAARVGLSTLPGGAIAATLSDADGRIIASIESVSSRPVPAGELAAAGRGSSRDPLLRISWTPLPEATPNGGPGWALLDLAGNRGAGLEGLGSSLGVHADVEALGEAVAAAPAAPGVVIADLRRIEGRDETASAPQIHELAARALAAIQAWLADERLAGSRLAFLTQGAAAVERGEGVSDLAAAAIRGLVRSAQSEYPGRFALVDVDGGESSLAALATALSSDEPQLAIRRGGIRAARLARAQAPEPDGNSGGWKGTVLITGGTGDLGALLARHLVSRHGVRHLLLASRSGPQAPGARELEAELRSLGASVSIESCDVADRSQLSALLGSVPGEQPLSGVVHAAVTVDNSMVASMTNEQLDTVLRPKLDGALHLHELTRDRDLRLFALCSSMAAAVGGPGQGNYAAANAFLDALAEHRRARGLPAVSIAWGLLSESVGRSKWLRGGDAGQILRHMSGSGSVRPLSTEQALAFFDRALVADDAAVIASSFDGRTLGSEIAAGTAPGLFSELVRARRRAPSAGDRAPASRGDGAGKRRSVGSEAIRAEIAAALGHESPAALDMEQSFVELGVDSLVGLELRNRLQALTGLELPTTLVFDHPTPATLIAHVQGLLGAGHGPDSGSEPAAPAAVNGDGSGSAARIAAPETLAPLFRRAHGLGKLEDGAQLVEAASRLRPRFGLSHSEEQAPPVVSLTSGPEDPLLFCIPSVIATAGPHEFTRLAKSFGDGRQVAALSNPGYGPGELLPSTIQAAAAAQAMAIHRHSDGRPFVLIGFSTGGLLAYAAAAQCARYGPAPAGTVLIDTYTADTMSELLVPVLDRMLESGRAHPAITDATLTAMVAYFRMLEDWQPPDPVAPTLLVSAAEATPGAAGEVTGATWPRRDAVVTVPGTHLTILEDEAETTARAIGEWVAALRPAARKGRLLGRLLQGQAGLG